jgi:phosphate transport system substrate-binding protein
MALLLGCSDSKNTGTNTVSGPRPGSKAKLRGAGSTFVKPLMEKWVKEYDKLRGGEVDYQGGGSSVGVNGMLDKSLNFGGTDYFLPDSLLDEARQKGGEVIHIPLVMGGIVVAYNVPGVDKPIHFTGEALADIYLGKITKWSDLKKIAENKDLNLPDKEIAVVARSGGSGSTNIFTDYLAKVSKEFKDQIGQGPTVKWKLGSTQKDTAGMTGFISKTENSLGYIEQTYAKQSKLAYGVIQNQAKKFAACTVASVRAAAAAALKDHIDENLRFSITNAPGDDSYPLAGTTWAVVYAKQEADVGPALVEFFSWVIHDGQKFAEPLDYARLPDDLVPKIDAKIKTIHSGK